MPWIPKSVWDEIRSSHSDTVLRQLAEIGWLRNQLEAAYLQRRQLERKEVGLPIRDAPERRPEETTPPAIMALVNQYPATVRPDLFASIREARAANPPLTWQEIQENIEFRLQKDGGA